MKLIDLSNLELYDEEIKEYFNNKIKEFSDDLEMVIQEDSFILFPLIGETKYLYIDTSTNISYRWSDTDNKYYQVGSDWHDITMINGQF
jgi:hypothetical protein